MLWIVPVSQIARIVPVSFLLAMFWIQNESDVDNKQKQRSFLASHTALPVTSWGYARSWEGVAEPK